MLQAATEAAKKLNTRGAAVSLLILAGYIFWAGLPATIWLRVDKVQVADSVVGQSPKMDVERSINLPFRGAWTVELERKTTKGYQIFRLSSGSNSYNTDADLPEDLDLDWWANADWRYAPAGEYRIETCWTIHLTFIKDRFTCKMSNPFKISLP